MITIDGFPLDLVVKEDHSLEAVITEHPVEQGSDVVDHIRPRPRTLMLSNAVVSNTPIGAIALDPTRQLELDDGDSLAQSAYRFLERIWLESRTVVVVTDLKRYPSMALESLVVPREASAAGGLVFNARFKEVRFVQNRRTTVLLPNTGGAADVGRDGKFIDGKRLLWQRGNPPGTNQATKPPGVIVERRVVVTRVKKNKRASFHHLDGTELSDQDRADLLKDLARDDKLARDNANRLPLEQRNAQLAQIDRNRTEIADEIAKGQTRPSKRTDPSLFNPFQ